MQNKRFWQYWKIIVFLEKKMNVNFEVRDSLANEYFYFHCDGKRSFSHDVADSCFVIWVYFNSDDEFDPRHKLQIIKK